MMMSQRDLKKEAQQEIGQDDVFKRWMQQRVEEVHRRVTVHDVLLKKGIKFRYSDREEQISCPFHGIDRMPSARVYPSDARGPSHVWCFVCNERWDVLGLWKKFDGRDDVKFSALLRDLEGSFGIQTPPPPEKTADFESREDPEENSRIWYRFESCENRLREKRKNFDMAGFLKVGVVLDRLRHQYVARRISAEKADAVIQQILDKVAEKVAACLED